MVTGFNTDVEYAGRKFHVQTQEQGLSNPVVETLVYCGGQLVTFVKHSYAQLAASPDCTKQAVFERMEDQHETLIRQILAGKFDPTPKPYGSDLVSNRSLDEVVVNYLDDSAHLISEVRHYLEGTTQEDEEDAPGEVPAHTDAHAAKVRARTASVRKLRRILARLEARIDEARSTPGAIEPTAPERRDPPSPRIVGASDGEARASRVERLPPPPRGATAAPRRVWAVAAAACALLAVVLFPIRRDAVTEPVLPAPPAWSEGADPTESALSNLPPPVETDDVSPVIVEDAGVAEGPVEPPDPEGDVVARAESVPQPRPKPVSPRPAVVASPRPRRVSVPEAVPATAPLPEPEAESTRVREPVRVAPPEEPAAADPTPHPAAPEPEAPPARPGQLVDFEVVDIQPRPVSRALPRYTRRARRLRQEGVVELALLVIENGRVAHAKLLEEIPDSDLGEVAIEAARAWEYAPARKDGVPVRVWKTARIRFAISPDRKASVRIEE